VMRYQLRYVRIRPARTAHAGDDVR
jgi:hypothetical protein